MKNLFEIICILLLTIFTPLPSNGAKILGIFPTMAKSHYIVGSALMKGLADKGHDVTVISPFPLKTPIKNWRDIPTTGVLEATKGILNNILNLRNQGVVESFVNLQQMGLFLTNISLQEENVQNLINSKNEKFDVIITEIFLNEAMLGFGPLFNAPIIGVSTFGASVWTCDLVGSPSPPSYVPSPFLGFTDHMTLIERIGNLAATILERLLIEFYYLPKQEALYNNNFPQLKTKLYDIRKNVSLVLLNNHFSISYPRPYVPNMIEVGGMHVNQNSKPLPTDIKNFIENSKYGVIYFSMGSNLKSKLLPKDKLKIIIDTFKSLKQNVLWKFEDTNLPGKPDNVFISDWFPQDDILAHPNVKLFITHGGLLSTTEAIYHGVPIIGIPMFGDQFLNMARAVKAGFGLELDYNTLNVDEFKSKILQILNNNEYSKRMKEISKRYRDKPMSSLDTAIYWVEYVLRHKGAPHLHSAGQDLSFIEYHNLDALLILGSGLIILISLLIGMIVKLLCCLCSCFSSKSKKQNVTNKKKKQ